MATGSSFIHLQCGLIDHPYSMHAQSTQDKQVGINLLLIALIDNKLTWRRRRSGSASASSASEKDATVAIGWGRRLPPGGRTTTHTHALVYNNLQCSAVLQRESSSSTRGSLFHDGRPATPPDTNPLRSVAACLFLGLDH